MQRLPAFSLLTGLLLLSGVAGPGASGPSPENPNLVLIMADDLGWGEVGCYGQEKIRTPHLDRMAAEGVRWTQFYAGAPVCAPSRCVLLTGKHSGHTWIRDNSEVQPEGQRPLRAEEVTIAEVLKGRGYATACIGKWGLGMVGTEGDPNRQGFDLFYGYNCQRHAHNHYPTYLRRNDQVETLEGNAGGDTGRQYSHDLFEREALSFVRDNRARPFFLYLAFAVPHLALQVPEDSLAEYRGKWEDPPYPGGRGYRPHPAPRAAYAAMVTRMDRTVGRLLEQLRDLGLDRRTLVLFTSDNGPTHGGIGGSDSAFFRSAGPFRGLKGDVYEGGLRVPLIARWPGRAPEGRVVEQPAYAPDLFPTLAEAAGARIPQDVDGISLVPALTGRGKQRQHDHLYWGFPGYGGQQAVRFGDWKGVRREIRRRGNLQVELYDLARDPGESRNLAAEHPDLVENAVRLMRESHRPAPLFPDPKLDGRTDRPKG